MDGSRTFRYLVHLGLLSVLLLTLAACAPQPTPTQPPTATPAPATATPTTPATPTEPPVEPTPTQMPATSEATQEATQETTQETTPHPATSEAAQDAASTEVDLAQLTTEEIIQRIQEKLKEPKEGEVALTFNYPGSMGNAAGVMRGVTEILNFTDILDELKELLARGNQVVIHVKAKKGWISAVNRWRRDPHYPDFCIVPNDMREVAGRYLFEVNPNEPFVYLNDDARVFLDGSEARRRGYVAGMDPSRMFGLIDKFPETQTRVDIIVFDPETSTFYIISFDLTSHPIDYKNRTFTFNWLVESASWNEATAKAIYEQCTIK